MKFNKLFTASLLAALAVSAYACGGDDDETCVNGTYDTCKTDTVARVCQSNQWIEIDCANSGKVCDNGKTNKCVEASGNGGNGDGGNGNGNGGNGDGGNGDGGNSGDGNCAGKLTTGGNVGDACDKSCYKQTCINGGSNALVCWDDQVTQWNCSTCQDAGYDSSKPLQVKCDKAGGGSSSADLPDDVKAAQAAGACTKAMCSSNGNAYFCDKEEGTYYFDAGKGTCSASAACVVCDNGYAGCGITCNGGGGGNNADLPDDVKAAQAAGACTKAMCSSNGNAYFCDKEEGTYYFDAGKGTCSASAACVVCDNGYAGCGITCNGGSSNTCDGEDYTGTCAADSKTAVVCVGGKTKNYTCFNDICETRDDGTIYCPKDQQSIDNEAARRASSHSRLPSEFG